MEKDIITQVYELYIKCYPDMFGTEDCIKERLANSENHFILRSSKDGLIGAAVINKNTILMLCVIPEFRKKGMGSDILKEAEKHIRAQGYKEGQLCNGAIYINPGAPLYEGNREFLEKRGYVHTWGEKECVDMMLELEKFPPTEYSLGDSIDGIIYRWADLSEREAVMDCAYQALPEFAQYYKDDALYQSENGERVLAAIRERKEGNVTVTEVCGVLLVDRYGELPNSGCVGCTSVKPSCARKGIASNMVRLGTKVLKDAGCTVAYLTYTYTDIVHMYARSGYEISMRYFMGKKMLK